MSKKNYIEIAKIIATVNKQSRTKESYHRLLIDLLCNYFMEDNSSFNSDKFKSFIDNFMIQTNKQLIK